MSRTLAEASHSPRPAPSSSHIAHLSLGSNLGDRLLMLRSACLCLHRHPDLELLKTSRLYETQPQYVTEQPHFLNICVSIRTAVEPDELLHLLASVENGLGRIREMRYGPRTIDIDILFFGDRVVEAAGLQIPHPRVYERAFVCVPLLEIAPELVDPRTRRPLVAEMAGLSQHGVCALGCFSYRVDEARDPETLSASEV
jgi:2-amino-4-hydroxy-6-hydroxymethyldihydropteridine diphosphokinase